MVDSRGITGDYWTSTQYLAPNEGTVCVGMKVSVNGVISNRLELVFLGTHNAKMSALNRSAHITHLMQDLAKLAHI